MGMQAFAQHTEILFQKCVLLYVYQLNTQHVALNFILEMFDMTVYDMK